MWSGGWCLEWLHPSPKAVQREEREREREIEREIFIVSFTPHKGLNSYKRGRYIGVQAPLAIHTNHSLTPLLICPHVHTCACVHIRNYSHSQLHLYTFTHIHQHFTLLPSSHSTIRTSRTVTKGREVDHNIRCLNERWPCHLLSSLISHALSICNPSSLSLSRIRQCSCLVSSFPPNNEPSPPFICFIYSYICMHHTCFFSLTCSTFPLGA